FEAEDGIRYWSVTGVQTCALPILHCIAINLRGSAEIYGDAVQIDGRIGGNLLVRARSVTIAKTAVLEGDAVFETLDDPDIEEGATLKGRQTVTLPRPGPRETLSIARALAAVVLFGIGAGLVLGLILLIA